jgi:hypothetical protein
MQFGTGVKSGTYETTVAEKQDFTTIIAYLMHIAETVFPDLPGSVRIPAVQGAWFLRVRT